MCRLRLVQRVLWRGILRARFLVLTMVLETLTEPSLRPPVVQEIVNLFSDQIDDRLSALESSSNQAFALEALRREIDPHRRKESIRASLRNMILAVLTDSEDSDDVARRVVQIYDKHSRLIHGGTVDMGELSRLPDEAREIVHRLLKIRFLLVTGGDRR